MAGEWRFNPSVHQAKGDRLVRARVFPVCVNEEISFKDISTFSSGGHVLINFNRRHHEEYFLKSF